jgi:hypothetical protein
MSRRLMALLLGATIGSTLSACIDGAPDMGTPTGPGPVTPVDTLAVASVTVTIPAPEVGPGVSTYATVVLRNANGNELTRRAVTWSSSNTSVARVDDAGHLDAIAPGTALITVSSEQRSGSALFTVLPIARVVISAAGDTLIRGHGLALDGYALDPQGQIIRRRSGWSALPASRLGFNISGEYSTDIVGLTDGQATVELWVAGVRGTRTFTVVPPVFTGIANIHTFTERCPTDDPAFATIRAQFEVRVEGAPIATPACTAPFSSMPIGALTDELLTLQALRTAYYLSQGTAGVLPWTTKALWEWMTTNVSGVNIKNAPGQLYCCDQINGRRYLSVSRQDSLTRDIKRTWTGLAWTIEYFAHEIRHADANAPGHTRGCTAFPNPTDSPGCDATYDLRNLGSYGVQYWLSRAWATGALDIGIGCALPVRARSYAESNMASANSYRDRFVSGVPPMLQLTPPYGECRAPVP